VYYPRSVFRLTLMALLVVALPLTAALIAVVFSAEHQADRGQQAVLESMEATRASRVLVDRLGLTQRQAGRYLVVATPELLATYEVTREQLLLAIRSLQGLLKPGPVRTRLTTLMADEQQMFERVQGYSPGDPAPWSKAEQAGLSVQAKQILQAMDEQSSHRLKEMEVAARDAGRSVLWPVLLVVPLTLLLAFLSAGLIVRPIRRMEQAVKDLGDSRFDAPIRIDGPGDVISLGEHLDWLRRRLRGLEQEKVRFLGHVSHELKTPLTAIRESAELLVDEVLGPLSKNQKEVADIMRGNAIKLQGLIEGLLNFNVGSMREDPRGRHPLEMDKLVGQVIAQHRPMLRKKRLQIREQLRPVSLEGDAEALSIVVDNLLSNAIKYSPVGARIDVDLYADARCIILDVKDRGLGFDAHDRKRVFEAFFQGRPPEGGSVPGTGLGLSIAAEHVKAHGGDLSIVDTPGFGGHLRAAFPVHSAPEENKAAWRRRRAGNTQD
jgi:two-component system sensor histidine kinase GlrK